MYTIDYTPYKLLDWIPLDKIDWDQLSFNPNATSLLEQNPDKIDWDYLSLNSKAIHLLEQNQDKINWTWLSENPGAIHLLEQSLLDPNQDEIYLNGLLPNPAIFEIDYHVLKKRIEPFKEELIQKCFHPTRLVRYLETYNYDIGDDEYQD